MVEYLGIKIAYIIKVMTEDDLLIMKGEAGSLPKVEDFKLLEKFNMWCTWYIQMNQVKLPTDVYWFLMNPLFMVLNLTHSRLGAIYQKAT